MRHLAFTFGLFAFCIIGGSPALAGESDEAWAKCVSDRMPASVAQWLAMPKPGNSAWSEFVIYDRNFAKGFDEELSTTDEFRSEFAALRLEAACKSEMVDEGGRPLSFKADRIRKSLLKSRLEASGVDLIDPEAHVCVAYRDNLIHAMVMGVGPSSNVRLKDPTATLRCFRITNDGKLVDERSTAEPGSNY